MKTGKVFSRLRQLATGTEGVYLKPPCSETAITELRVRSKAKLGTEPPEDYLTFLAFSNGIQISNVIVGGAEVFVGDNLDLREIGEEYKGLLRFGSNGNVDELVFDTRDQKFKTVNCFDPKDVVEEFKTFEDMLTKVLEEQIENC